VQAATLQKNGDFDDALLCDDRNRLGLSCDISNRGLLCWEIVFDEMAGDIWWSALITK
jgi:hypothetical protein